MSTTRPGLAGEGVTRARHRLQHHALALVLQPARVEALRLLVRLPMEVLGSRVFFQCCMSPVQVPLGARPP